MSTVPDAAVEVMDERLTSPSPPPEHLQSLTDFERVQTVTDLATDDLAQVGIVHQTQLGAALPSR